MAESTNLKYFTDQNFETEVLKASEPVLVDFWAEWCGPCVRLGPTIAELADDLAGKVKVGKLNVDDNPEITRRYRIQGIPAVLIFEGGQMVQSLVGLQPKASYLKALMPPAEAR